MSQGLFLNGRTPALPYPLRPCNGKHKDNTTIKQIRMEGNTKKLILLKRNHSSRNLFPLGRYDRHHLGAMRNKIDNQTQKLSVLCLGWYTD